MSSITKVLIVSTTTSPSIFCFLSLTYIYQVGSGPSGLILALSLAQQGIPVRVIEKSKTYRIGQRGAAILVHAPTTSCIIPSPLMVISSHDLWKHSSVLEFFRKSLKRLRPSTRSIYTRCPKVSMLWLNFMLLPFSILHQTNHM